LLSEHLAACGDP